MEDQLQQARALIKAKRYAEARRLLKTINHPKAQEWLKTLDQIAPVESTKPQPTPKTTTTETADVPDKVKLALVQAGELVKKQEYAKALRLLESLDHPKAQEWRERIQKLAIPPTNPKAKALPVDAAVKPLTVKPLPEIAEQHKSAQQETSLIFLMIGGSIAALIILIPLLLVTNARAGSLLGLGFEILMVFSAIGGIGLAYFTHNSRFGRRLAPRMVIFVVVIMVYTVVSFVNSFRTLSVTDPVVQFQYPAVWNTIAFSDDETCSQPTETWRCVSLLWRSIEGNTVYLHVWTETRFTDADLIAEDEYDWNYVQSDLKGQLISMDEILLDEHPARIRHYSYVYYEQQRYALRYVALSDAQHVVFFEFYTTKPETLDQIQNNIPIILNSVDFP